MTHIMIEDSSPEAKKLLAYVRTLPYVTVIDAKKKGFAEEAAACNAVPVSVFTQKMHSQMAPARISVCSIRERLGFCLRSIRRWYHYTGYVPYCNTEGVRQRILK